MILIQAILAENIPCLYSVPREQWMNSVPPCVRKLHFVYEVFRTSSKGKVVEHIRVAYKIERSSPMVTAELDETDLLSQLNMLVT